MSDPIPCRCGLLPERNTAKLRPFNLSLSCKCGGEEINFLVRSDSETRLLDNWESLILKKPYKHYVEKIKDPMQTPAVRYSEPGDIPNRYRQTFHGGCC